MRMCCANSLLYGGRESDQSPSVIFCLGKSLDIDGGAVVLK